MKTAQPGHDIARHEPRGPCDAELGRTVPVRSLTSRARPTRRPGAGVQAGRVASSPTPTSSPTRARYTEAAKRYRELEPIAAKAALLRSRHGDLETGDERWKPRRPATIATSTGPSGLRPRPDIAQRLEGELQTAPSCRRTRTRGAAVIVEIRGAGGWGRGRTSGPATCSTCTRRIAARQGWRLEVLAARSDLGGLRRGRVQGQRRRRAGPHPVTKPARTACSGSR
jgi:hypothetical protein